MAFDTDIQAMSKKQIQQAIRDFKQLHPDSKLKVSGNLPELTQHLQSARNDFESTAAAVQSDIAGPNNAPRLSLGSMSVTSAASAVPSTSGSTPAQQSEKGSGPDLLLLDLGILHPVTVCCMEKLSGEAQDHQKLIQDSTVIKRMEPMLKSVANLVRIIVSIRDGMSELNSSSALNLGVAFKIIRSHIPSATAPPEAWSLFQAFGIDVTNSVSPPESTTTAIPSDTTPQRYPSGSRQTGAASQPLLSAGAQESQDMAAA